MAFESFPNQTTLGFHSVKALRPLTSRSDKETSSQARAPGEQVKHLSLYFRHSGPGQAE